jgi:hypothetical protein
MVPGASVTRESARHPKREVLSQVADTGRASGEGRGSVFQSARSADHEIAEVSRYRRALRQAGKIVRGLQNQASTTRHVRALRRRIAHAPIQADAVSVYPVPRRRHLLVDLRVSAAALVLAAEAELCVEHDRALRHAPLLVVALAADIVFR